MTRPVALRGNRDDHEKAQLLATAADHLREHALDESAHAIRKHEAVSDAEERIVEADELDRLPTDGWATDVAIVS